MSVVEIISKFRTDDWIVGPTNKQSLSDLPEIVGLEASNTRKIFETL